MTDTAECQTISLFRYGLIAELLQLPSGSRGLYARLREKAAADYVIPGSSRTRVAAQTLRHWIKDYRRGGFDALYPKGRADRGRSRALPQALADALLSLKEEQPRLSIPQLVAAVGQAMPEAPTPAASTVHRLLKCAGLMDKAGNETEAGGDRRRFAFAHPGQLWMSDVMHGPSVGMLARASAARPTSSPSSTTPRGWCRTARSRCRRTPRRSCRCSSRPCCVAASRSGCTSTTAPTTARSSSRWCVPSSASR